MGVRGVGIGEEDDKNEVVGCSGVVVDVGDGIGEDVDEDWLEVEIENEDGVENTYLGKNGAEYEILVIQNETVVDVVDVPVVNMDLLHSAGCFEEGMIAAISMLQALLVASLVVL